MPKIPHLNTIGKVAEELHQPVHRIQYVLRTRPHIQPAALAGRSRLFDSHAISQLRQELNRIDSKVRQ